MVFKDVSESTLIFLTGKSNNHEAKWHLGSVSDTRKNWQSATEVPVAQATGTLFEINQSIPKLNLQLSEKFLPQELNLDTGNGLSFEKGCFPGQEIIARVKYRGKINDTILNILGGVRSSCTYVGAPSLKQLSKCTTFVRVTKQFNDTFVK